MKGDKITIHDLAKILNVDSSTVSRALNNSPRVNPKTKEKVLAKAMELGYKINHLASNLRKNKTNTLGVIVPRISRHFFSAAIAGIEEKAYQAGYNVLICQSLEQLDREEKIAGTLLSNRVDGVLISISMETLNYDHLHGFKQNNIPIVFFDRHCDIAGNSNVIIDDFQAGFDATEHLILNGCKAIVHFAGTQNLEIYRNRLQGYRAALNKYKIPFNDDFVICSKLMKEDGVENAKKLLLLPYKVDGIFSANDVAAINAIRHLKSEGLRIPQDIAVVGFSNESMSSVVDPSLSTINQSGFEIGQMATDLLLTQIRDRGGKLINKTLVLKSSLIIRESSVR